MTKDKILAEIIAFRKLEGMSKSEAAANYGCGLSFWGEIENGHKTASIETLGKMADAVGLKLELDLTVK